MAAIYRGRDRRASGDFRLVAGVYDGQAYDSLIFFGQDEQAFTLSAWFAIALACVPSCPKFARLLATYSRTKSMTQLNRLVRFAANFKRLLVAFSIIFLTVLALTAPSAQDNSVLSGAPKVAIAQQQVATSVRPARTS